MAQAELLAEFAESQAFVTRAVVRHDALDLETEACVIAGCSPQKGGGASLLLAGHNLEGDARVIVDGDMDELPADAPAIALTFAIAGDAVADAIEAAELLIPMWIISPGLARS
jgi:hypothetical protein